VAHFYAKRVQKQKLINASAATNTPLRILREIHEYLRYFSYLPALSALTVSVM